MEIIPFLKFSLTAIAEPINILGLFKLESATDSGTTVCVYDLPIFSDMHT